MYTEKIEQHIKRIIKQAGYKVSSNQLKDLVKEFNNYEQPISMCLMGIVHSPKKFLDFLKEKEL
tara:strand:- start:4341 stop:4532 length:192 start_codon:yes stop_codon:yes gene_type:complete